MTPDLKPNEPIPLSLKPLHERETRFISWKMSKEATLKFATLCKQHGVTFNSG